MKPFLILLSLFFCCSLFAQKQVRYYKGGHYGAHKPWRYTAKITTQKKGDTLLFERLVYKNKNNLNELNNVRETDKVMLLMFDENHVRVLSDTLSFDWPTGPKRYTLRKRDSLKIQYKDPKRINFDFAVGEVKSVKPNALTFTSVAALELYLAHCNLYKGFEKDFLMADSELRPFRVRVLDIVYFGFDKKNVKACYDISINPLDKKSLHAGKIFMTIGSKTVVKREFVSNELLHKSVLNEFLFQQI